MDNNKVSILIVDDEEPIRKLLATSLGSRYHCVATESAEEATQMLGATSFNLVITDIMMPGASGLELCQLIHEMCPDTIVLVISAMTDIQFAIEAMRQGAFDYLSKPFDLSHVFLAIDRALRYQGLLASKHSYERSLEEMVRARTGELRSLNEGLNGMLESLYKNYRATLRALARVLEVRSIEMPGHSDQVVAYCLRIGKEVGLPHGELIALEQGALLHDIGKVAVPDHILAKTGPLSEDEWIEMREHVKHGLKFIDGIELLAGARYVVGQHHEKYDGSGYPGRLRGEAIHIHARIFAVADAFDSMTSARPYREAGTYAHARAEILANSGKQFDPIVVKAFLNVDEREWAEIRQPTEPRDYIEKLIDEREIRTLIVSLKTRSGVTGPLNLAR